MRAHRPYRAGCLQAESDLGLYPVEAPPPWTKGQRVTVPSSQEKRAFVGADRLHGGPADKKEPSDFDPKELRKGQHHEMEHTTDPALAREIASDHLVEMPDYYEKILKLEKK